MAIQTGDAIGDYTVIELVGSGGMGAVYKIEHAITKRIEAMKVLPLGMSTGPEEVQRFEREIQVQARLHHPNIAALYNAVRDGNSIGLIMEYVEGESLQRMLERGRLPLRTAVDYAGQVLDALAYAHEKGVVHRDVTPANIIITPEGAAKLTDFGLARAITDLRLTTTGVAVGSAWYMSPEQVRAVGELDARTDIYAMGAVLHEMLTGRKLFDADGSFAIMRAQMETAPEPPSAHNREVPPALDEVAARALAKDPAARFQTAGEFRLGLDAIMGEMRASDGASNSKPAVRRLREIRRSRAAAVLVCGLVALAAITSTVLVRSHAARLAAQSRVPPATTVMQPAAVIAPPPVVAAEPAAPVAADVDPTPEVPVAPAKPPARSGSSPARSLRFVSSGAMETPSATPPPKPAVDVAATPPEAPAVRPGDAVTPEEPLRTGIPNSPAEPENAAPMADEAKPAKTGNRFRRALNKLNPFGKRGKDDPAVPAQAATKKD